MNIEEESIGAASVRQEICLDISIPESVTVWCRAKAEFLREIGEALRDIRYDKTVVMEPL